MTSESGRIRTDVLQLGKPARRPLRYALGLALSHERIRLGIAKLEASLHGGSE